MHPKMRDQSTIPAQKRVAWTRAAFAAGLIACGVSGFGPWGGLARAEEPLGILLINDDGIEAEGLRAMKRALIEAGHRVTVYAPQTNWSGSSAALTLPSVAVVERRPGEFAVAGSPATAALVAAAAWEGSPPDVAISGINHGSNAGAVTLFSGTVGGALVAAGPFGFGVPAMAVSADLFGGEPTTDENRAHLARVARLAVRLVEQLVHSADGSLPPGAVLNVNYPALSSPRGIAVCAQGRRSLYRLGYERLETGEYAVKFGRVDGAEDLLGQNGDERSDTIALARGFVTIAPLRSDYTARDLLRDDWRTRLEAIGATAGREE